MTRDDRIQALIKRTRDLIDGELTDYALELAAEEGADTLEDDAAQDDALSTAYEALELFIRDDLGWEVTPD